MGAAAAGLAFKNQEVRKRAAEAKARAAQQRARDRQVASANFDAIDVGGKGALTRHETHEMLRRVTGFATIDEDGLDAVFVPMAKAAREASDPGITVEPLATKEDIIEGIAVYREFLVRYREIHKLVNKFDADGSGDLDREELRNVILYAEEQLRKRNERTWNEDMIEDKDKRDVWGLTMELVPTDAELAVIFEACDVNGDGCINRAEVLPALAVWSQLAHQRITREKQGCCTVL